jgi:hypothetical protein
VASRVLLALDPAILFADSISLGSTSTAPLPLPILLLHTAYMPKPMYLIVGSRGAVR